MKKIKISIFGSCITRDNFNSKFIADWREYFDLCSSHFQSSLLSLVSPPISNIFLEDENLNDYDKNWINNEVKKNIWQKLINEKPDYIIFDLFSDANFKCVEIGDSYFTLNEWRIKNTNIERLSKDNKVLSFDNDIEYFLSVFEKSLLKLKLKIEQELPKCKLILNSSRPAAFYFDDHQNKVFFNKASLVKFNERLDFLEKIFKKILDPILLNLSAPQFASDMKHPWGAYFFHYEQSYYRSFFKVLLLITGLERNDNKTLQLLGQEKLNAVVHSDVRLLERKWFKGNEHVDNGNHLKINAPVYKNGYLLNDAMLVRAYGQIQYGSVYKNIWPEVSFQKAIYGGFLVDHYGHFILESLARVWAYKFLELPIVFQTPKNLDKFEKLPKYMQQIFQLIKIPQDKLILVDKPTAVGELIIPESLTFINCYISPLFNKFYGIQLLDSTFKAHSRIYLSRSRVNSSTGSPDLVNEKKLEKFLNDYGFVTIHPHEYSVEQQVHFLSNCEVAIGGIGSAFLTFLLCRKLPKKLIYLVHTSSINSDHPTMDQVLGLESTYISFNGNDIDFSCLRETLNSLDKII